VPNKDNELYNEGYLQGTLETSEKWIVLLELIRQDLNIDTDSFQQIFQKALGKISTLSKNSSNNAN